MNVDACGPVALAVIQAIRGGDLETLERLLGENPGLAAARIGPRTLLHLATDWPGHFPQNVATVKALIAAGAEVNAQTTGKALETPLHWAASSDDVAVLDTLLDAGADIEAQGAVIGGGTPLADAVAFGQWQAARRLIERGARANLWQAAALGLMNRVASFFNDASSPPHDEVNNAFWCACHGGQQAAVAYLLERGADINWIGHNNRTPIEAARRSGASALVEWLERHGAGASS
jgi:ankyrin repeat protein